MGFQIRYNLIYIKLGLSQILTWHTVVQLFLDPGQADLDVVQSEIQIIFDPLD